MSSNERRMPSWCLLRAATARAREDASRSVNAPSRRPYRWCRFLRSLRVFGLSGGWLDRITRGSHHSAVAISKHDADDLRSHRRRFELFRALAENRRPSKATLPSISGKHAQMPKAATPPSVQFEVISHSEKSKIQRRKTKFLRRWPIVTGRRATTQCLRPTRRRLRA